MADEEKKEEKGSRPNSAASSKSSKSDKSHKSHKSDKSHKSERPKSAKDSEQTVAEGGVTNGEAAPAQEAETVAAPPEAVECTPSEAPAATQEVEPVKAEAVEAAPEDGAPASETEAAPVPAEPEPEPVEKEQSGLHRAKSVLDDLTSEERERFEALFDTYATEEGGVKKLTTSGIKLLFRFMGEIVSETILAQWLREEDKDVDGMYDFEEFCSLYKKRRQPKDKRKEDMLMSLNQLFPRADNEDDDSLSLDKVSSVMKRLINAPQLISEKTTLLTDADIDDVIAKIDVNMNKKISRQEFVNFLCSLE